MAGEQDTPVQTSDGFLMLPAAGGGWDVELPAEPRGRRRVSRLAAGTFSLGEMQARRARRAGTADWTRVRPAAALVDTENARRLTEPTPPDPPLTTFEVPGTWFAAGETPSLLVSPPDAAAYELWVRPSDRSARASSAVFDRNDLPLQGLDPGAYRVRARYLKDDAPPGAWSAWSRPLSVRFIEDAAEDELRAERERAHRLQLIADTDAEGVTTITSPGGWPPACPREGRVAMVSHGRVRGIALDPERGSRLLP